jgi:hypothetical protein
MELTKAKQPGNMAQNTERESVATDHKKHGNMFYGNS